MSSSSGRIARAVLVVLVAGAALWCLRRPSGWWRHPVSRAPLPVSGHELPVVADSVPSSHDGAGASKDTPLQEAEDSLCPPKKPGLSPFTNAGEADMQTYLKELWGYSSQQLTRELDAICRAHGARAALALISEVAFGPDGAPPAFVGGAPRWKFAVNADELDRFDFGRWFRALQLVRMIPYVVTQYPGPGAQEEAATLILSLLQRHPDTVMRRCAAATLSDTDSFIYPAFLPLRTESGAPFALACSFPHAKAASGQECLARCLLPLVVNNDDVARGLASVLEAERDVGVRSALMDASTETSHADVFQLAYFKTVADTSAPDWLREDALKLLHPTTATSQLRRVFEDAITTQNEGGDDTRQVFLDRVATCFPRDPQLCTQVARIASRAEETMYTRATAAHALFAYYDQGLRQPELSDALSELVWTVALHGKESELSSIAQDVADHRVVEIAPLLRRLVAQMKTLDPAPRDLVERTRTLDAVLDTLRSSPQEDK